MCPFHNENAVFTVNEAKGFYHCFGCGDHGDIGKVRDGCQRSDFYGISGKASP
ncbi:MAG: CHC2 zinc finger domain-containing protein [Alphaproteobacteria bacterium]